MFNTVDHIITRHGIDTQTGRLASIVTSLAGAGVLPWPLVTVAVTALRLHAVLRCSRLGTSDGSFSSGTGSDHAHSASMPSPSTSLIACTVGGVAANRHGYGVARFRMGHGTAQGLPRSHFRRVDDVIARHGIDGDGWQRGIDQQVCGIARCYPPRWSPRRLRV